MKFDFVGSWDGTSLPKRFAGLEGPFEVAGTEIESFAEQYDVAIMHHPQEQPTKKAQRAGAPTVPDQVALWFDRKGGKFRQR